VIVLDSVQDDQNDVAFAYLCLGILHSDTVREECFSSSTVAVATSSAQLSQCSAKNDCTIGVMTYCHYELRLINA
jgi:hypothetical protein